MRAVVLEEYGRTPTVQTVEPLPLLPNDVRVQTGASGVCHSDMSVIAGQYPYLSPPLIMGHEGAGRVLEVGSNVTLVKPGDRVIASWRSSCGHCWQCVKGRQHLCESSQTLADRTRVRRAGQELTAHHGLGTMAELMTVNEANLVKVNTELPDEVLALIGCGVTTGVGAALWTANVQPGATAAVFGCGGVGLSAIQGCRIAGATTIVAIDPMEDKRAAALALGATHAIDPTGIDVVAAVRDITQGHGADYTFEVVGLTQTMEQAYKSASRGGKVVFVGALRPEIGLTLPANALHAEGKSILGSSYGSAQARRDMPTLVSLVEAGRLDVESMVSNRAPLEGIGAALEAIEGVRGIRTVLIP